MRASRIAPYREHTGDVSQERVQRERNAMAGVINNLIRRIEILEGFLMFPLGRVGHVLKPMNNQNQVLTEDQAKRWLIQPSGALTAARTLSGFPRPKSVDETYARVFQSGTTGGFGTVISNGGAATYTLADGATKLLGFSEGGVFLVL